MGRGFSHKSGCSLARPSGGVPKRGRKAISGRRPIAGRKGKRGRKAIRGRRPKATIGNSLDLRVLKGMAVEELVKVRDSVTKFIKSKAPSIKQKIKALQDTLSSIR